MKIKMELDRMGSFVAITSEHRPALTDSKGFASDVVNVIKHEENRKSHHRYRTHAKLLTFLGVPGIRFALVTILIIITGSFVLQEVLFYRHISRLEDQMGKEAATSGPIAFNLLGRPMIKRKLSSALMSKATHNLFHFLSDNRLIIKPRMRKKLFYIYRKLKGENKGVFRCLREKAPLITDLVSGQSVQLEEVEHLFENRGEILSCIKQF
jgi:hypothetical protein